MTAINLPLARPPLLSWPKGGTMFHTTAERLAAIIGAAVVLVVLILAIAFLVYEAKSPDALTQLFQAGNIAATAALFMKIHNVEQNTKAP